VGGLPGTADLLPETLNVFIESTSFFTIAKIVTPHFPTIAFQWVAFLAQQILSQRLFGEEGEAERRQAFKEVNPG
jgi:hypothetical protein